MALVSLCVMDECLPALQRSMLRATMYACAMARLRSSVLGIIDLKGRGSMTKNVSQTRSRIRLLWVALLLAAGVTVLLVACGGTGSNASPTRSGATATIQTGMPTTVVHVKIVEKNGKYTF